MSPDQPHYLYVCYNADDEPIYVGITGNVACRMRNHRAQSPWFHEVDHIESLWCADKEDASELERCYAFAIRPKHNKRLVPGRAA